MHTYMKHRENYYTVGIYIPFLEKGGEKWGWYWRPFRDCRSEAEAMALVSYLNGGKDPYS